MKQVFYNKDGTKTVVEASEVIKNVVTAISQIDVLHPLVTPEDAAARFEVCKTCPLFEPVRSQCKKCTCFMRTKVRFTSSKCPMNKWEK